MSKLEKLISVTSSDVLCFISFYVIWSYKTWCCRIRRKFVSNLTGTKKRSKNLGKQWVNLKNMPLWNCFHGLLINWYIFSIPISIFSAIALDSPFIEQGRVSICNALTHHYIYKWTSVSPHGTVQFAINRHYMNSSLLMGMLKISHVWCHQRKFLNDFANVCRYFQEVLQSSRLPSDTNEIQLLNDGSWTAHDSNADANCLDTPRKSTQKVEVISDDIGTEIEINFHARYSWRTFSIFLFNRSNYRGRFTENKY